MEVESFVNHNSKKNGRSILGKDDWIAAALTMLVKEGIAAVEITRLANELSVSRGSFYWHFKDRGDLLAALIDEWRQLNSDSVRETLSNAANLEDGILGLFSVWVSMEPFNAKLDQAMRDWARLSDAVKRAVEQEDESRIGAIQSFFEKQGYADTEAFIRARIIYFTQVSYYSLGVNEPMAQRLSYLKEYYRCFTGREINDQTAEAYCEIYSNKELVA